jgi:hypothetical protein
MAKKSLDTNANPSILVERIGNDLNVKGWDRPQVLVKSSSDNDIVLEERDDQIVVSTPSDCVLYVPYSSTLQVNEVSSGARFKSLGGEIKIGTVGNDLVLRDVGATQVETVGSEISAKRVRGDLKATTIRGNAVVRDVDGQFSAEIVSGELHLRDVSGGITAQAGGNAYTDFSPVPWQVYSIQAGGSIRCRVPGDANVDFEIFNAGQEIRIRTMEGTQRIKEGEYTFTLGEGGVQVKLTAGSTVDIRTLATEYDAFERIEVDFGAEIGSMADEIAESAVAQVEAQLEMINSQLDTHLSGLSETIRGAGLSAERAQEVQERLETAKERAAVRAEAAAERARAKLELKLAAAQRKADRKARASAARAARKERHSRGDRRFVIPTAPPPLKPIDPVSEEERMMILQMLQDKKISVDQAEKLLAALDGRGG